MKPHSALAGVQPQIAQISTDRQSTRSTESVARLRTPLRCSQFLARVLECRQLAPDIISCWLEAGAIARQVQPGQFVQVRVGPGFVPFLRRPFSIAERRETKLRVVFRAIGQGTRRLAAAQVGDKWDIIGPLGKPTLAVKGRSVVIIGGGIGIAPLLFLAQERASTNELHVLLGARSRAELLLRNEFRKLRARVVLATEDGSVGIRGLVTDLFAREIHLQGTKTPENSVVFACGPRPMLRRVKELTTGLEAYAFWEERLGCGTGICYCCAVKRVGSECYLRFCRDGPVLKLSEIVV